MPSSPRQWLLVPSQHGGTFAETADRLASLPKPIVIGALNHPGYVAVWRPHAFDADERRRVEHTLRNQQAWLDRMLAQFGGDEAALVLFEGWCVRTSASVVDIRRWLGEYALTWGWTFGPPTDASHQARLLVLKDGVRWSPGDVCVNPAAI